jgi:hypothetical protein
MQPVWDIDRLVRRHVGVPIAESCPVFVFLVGRVWGLGFGV